MTDNRDFWKQVIIRYPVDGANTPIESTPETRRQGLEAIKMALMNPEYTRFPPEDIITMDTADPENPPPLDHFFLDNDIRDFMKEDIQETDLTTTFVQDFPDAASKCWSGHNVSAWARGLGFPIPELNDN